MCGLALIRILTPTAHADPLVRVALVTSPNRENSHLVVDKIPWNQCQRNSVTNELPWSFLPEESGLGCLNIRCSPT